MEKDDFISIRLSNFQKWEEKEIRLQRGINLISGPSGAGKSTIARAVHFCLYGGSKYKISLNQKKKKSCFVEMKFNRENLTIKRERPTEIITVDDNGKIYRGEDAQGLIESKFGTEESWICSSYLAQEKDNFFMGETNAKKKELLNEIVFGRSNNLLDPDVLLDGIKTKISELKLNSTVINETIKAKYRDLDKMEEKYQNILDYDEVDDDFFTDVEKVIDTLREDLRKIDIELHDKIKYEKYEKRISILKDEIDDINIDNTTDLKLVQEKIELKQRLKQFNSEILNVSRDELYRNKSIYDFLFSKGLKEDQSIEQFKEIIDRKKLEYENYLLIKNQNDQLEKTNTIIRLENEQLKQRYDKKREKYENYIKIQSLVDKLNSTKIKSHDDDDDLSIEYCWRKIEELQMMTKELNCPHCGMGVLINKNKELIQGHSKNEEDRLSSIQKLKSVENELEKRKEQKKLSIDIEKLNDININTVEEVQDPAEPEYKEELKIRKITKVEKQDDFQIEIPTMKNSDVKVLISSLNDLKYFERLKQLENIDENIDIQKIRRERTIFSDKNKELEMTKKMIKELNLSMENPEQKKTEVENKIRKYEQKIKFFSKVNEYVAIEKAAKRLKREHNDLLDKIEDLEELYLDIEGIARDTVDNFICTVNTNLQDICDKLFDRPIEISLQTTKELKTTGKEKATINLYINYDGIVYDNPSDLSGGEKKRVSLALSLAFMKSNPSKIRILDEVLPSMDDDLKNKVLEVIIEECDGFIINICHGIQEGKHDNVINILKNKNFN